MDLRDFAEFTAKRQQEAALCACTDQTIV